ncbi:MAG: DEAD/DEAH box helicase, partial [Elusimicrobiota bacterium]
LGEAVLAPVQAPDRGATVADLLAGCGGWLIEEGVEHPEGVQSAAVVRASSGTATDWSLDASSRFPAGGGIDEVVRRVLAWKKAGVKSLLFSMNRGEDERIQEMLEGRLPAGAVQFLIGPLRQGFELGKKKLAVLASAEIFGRSYRPPRGFKPLLPRRVRARWGELKKGDYVVHENYGVARYLGLETVRTKEDPEASERPARQDGTRRLGVDVPAEIGKEGATDCLRLEFRGSDALFVPMDEFRSVQKYIGAEGHRPRLSSLDSRSWVEVKERVREGVRELAEELIKAHAARRAVRGHAFEPDTHMEEEFARSFPFEETPDQRKAIEEVKADMIAPHPMDRVIVGDVGFGKTEVAMRAVLKCAASAKQAAVLVPTTILADQHLRTFRRRFAEYPIRIEMMSRFQTKKDQARVLKAAADGTADVVIGTHRLLQKDVRFKDLGLVVADEEHRFGVKHKEGLKKLRKSVDCLSLSATPIPRTLNQCLSGLRAISLIQSAPTGRQPIMTAVLPFNEAHVKSAIEAELSRGGQVFFVHNRVRSLPQARKMIEALLPEARVGMAHGQMRAESLERTMWDFFEKKFDVLVASSIIESGLDIPSVNTLLIENAQDFGLSQLYQLRGRIGRERRRAFCNLYYPAETKRFSRLSDEAKKRLEAMRDFADLGSGFTLAMRDLEIRGAGDLLGAKQSGFLNAVGVEFYSELLDAEIAKLKGKTVPAAPAVPAHLDLALPAHIPEDYVPGDLERIQFYKRLLGADAAEAEAVRKELADLSGPPPPAVENLFTVMSIRRAATALSVRAVVQRGARIEIYFHKHAAVPVSAITRWTSAYKDRIEFLRSGEGDGLRVWVSGRDPVTWISDFLEGLSGKGRGHG